VEGIPGLKLRKIEDPVAAAKGPKKRVAVFGAGIAGLTVAHELAKAGYAVSVYEASNHAGGFFRSARVQASFPTEYSWHGFGPWYHNVFDLLKDIPFDGTSSLYERALSRPIDFGVFPNRGTAEFYDRGMKSIRRMFRFSRWELVPWAWLMLKVWSARRRSEEHYSQINADAAWGKRLSPAARTAWRACFGPWIGSDWTNVSLHQAGHFFRKQLITQPSHYHAADADGPAWFHGAGDGWLLLRGPSSELWFDRWIMHLRRMDVEFHWGAPLDRVWHRDHEVTGASLKEGTKITADFYVMAITPFAALEVIERTPELARIAPLDRLRPLVQDGPHVQVSFQIGFAETIRFPRKRMAVVLADSEFNLTLFAQEQAWLPDVALGDGIQALWTGTSCAGTVPGKLFRLPVRYCTKEQFIAEVRAQILACGSLDALVREANDGRSLSEFEICRIEIWSEWKFSPQGIGGPPPKWVNTTRTQPFLPAQETAIKNLFLAGAHTRTQADVWSIEAAVESGRRAVNAIDSRVPVIDQYLPWWLRVIGRVDDMIYSVKGPHVLDLLLAAVVVGGGGVVAMLLW
jgi:hypothetical protein